MNIDFAFLLMVFLHIVDDYYLQGILANLKQKSWWQKNAPDDLYKYDYLIGLAMHSMSWAFMIMLPIAYMMNFRITAEFEIAWLINAIIHAAVDDTKANRHAINLIQDQTVHMLQIIITLIVFKGVMM